MTEEKTYPYSEQVPLERLVANLSNPNEQDEATFNGLVASISEEGWFEPMCTAVPNEDGTYSIVSGHHRVDAARVIGYESGPVWVLDPVKFDKDRQDWVLVKANMLRGKMNPAKFTTLYSRMVREYGAETLQALMGFTSEDAFRNLFQDVRRALPPELAKALDDQKGEIRTIDDLSLVLNRLFREHGEDLPSNMMVFSFGGKDVLWVRADAPLWAEVQAMTKEVREGGKDMAALVLERLLAGKAASAVPV